MGPSTDRVTTSWVPWIVAACSIIRWHSKGQSCIKPSIRSSLQKVLSLVAGIGIAMNFSAAKARRKWPCGGLACGERTMVTAAAALLVLCALADPVAAARRPGAAAEALWSGLFGAAKARPRKTVLPRALTVPLPRPRPPDAPATESEQPAAQPTVSP